jgi:phage terminase large subunit-like protein
VLDGSILACKWIKLACQRQLDDLKRSESSDFPYRYDPAKANKVCRYIETKPHTKGRWAARHQRLKLQPWQCFKTCVLFGWVHKETGRYRFTKAYCKEPRKNGKSPWAAAVGHFKFSADGEFGAEVYSGATTEKQAWEVFKPAKLMAERDADYLKHFGITVHAKSMTRGDGSKFEPIIGKPGDGASPSCAIVDEFHEHLTDDLVDTMETGMVGRENPLLLIITTAGDDISGPCYALEEDCKKVLEGAMVNDNLLVIIYEIDEGDDWTTEEALRKANPNYGVSVDPDKLLAGQREAIQSARKQNTFKRKHLNIWTNTAVGWMNLEDWAKCYDKNLNIEDFKGDPCMNALDLSTKKDLASTLKMFRRVMDEKDPSKDHFYLFGRHYVTEGAIASENGHFYEQCVKEGWLVKTPGQATDMKRILHDIVEDAKIFKIREIPHDPHLALVLTQFIEDRADWDQKVTFVEVPQRVEFLSTPMKEIEAVILDGRLHHNGDRILTWGVSNVICKEDVKGNLFPRKPSGSKKIDPAICMLMDMNRWMAAPREAPRSVYSKRGIRRL